MSILLAPVVDIHPNVSYRSALSSTSDSPLPVGSRDMPVLHFRAESEIYAEGDFARSFYKVMRGVVRTCKFLSDGRRQIDAFYVAGDVFGFEIGTEHGLSAEAVSDCTLAPCRRYGQQTMTDDSGIALEMLSYAMRCLERTRAHSLLLGRSSATQKLAAFLLEMASGKVMDKVIDLAMTRQDIADYLGLTIETVSRTLSQLERDGVISLLSARRVMVKNSAALKGFNA
jgi:CRP/FNR family transcriptional regulator, nitrogen fixation regulation protein